MYKRPQYLELRLYDSECAVMRTGTRSEITIAAFVNEFDMWANTFKSPFTVKINIDSTVAHIKLYPSRKSFALLVEEKTSDGYSRASFDRPRGKDKLMEEFKHRLARVSLGGEF